MQPRPHDLTKLFKFSLQRNLSEIVGPQKQICTINNNGDVYLKISSTYVPEADGEIVEFNVMDKPVHVNVYHDGKRCWYTFTLLTSSMRSAKNRNLYTIQFTSTYMTKSLKNTIGELFGSGDMTKGPGLSQFVLPTIKEHHYGSCGSGWRTQPSDPR